MRARILALVAFEAVLGAGGLWTVGRQAVAIQPPGVGRFAVYTVVFTILALLPRMQVEFRRHACWITPADCALLVGLFALGPIGFVAAAMLAEVPAAIQRHQDVLKTTFNLVHVLGGLVAAAATFTVLDLNDPLDPVTWLAGIVALATLAAWDMLSTAAVMAAVEGNPYRTMLERLAPAAVVSFVVSAMLGIAALVLFNETPFGPLLFAPVFVIVLISTRGVTQQRAERQHIERLHAASSNLTQLVGLSDMLGMVASEARGLVTGASALCCAQNPGGIWIGMLIDDHGAREAPDGMVAALMDAIGDGNSGEVKSSELARTFREQLPPFLSMVWAVKRRPSATGVILAVFRELPHDEQEKSRSDLLTAFVAHAAVVLTNVGLHEEVQHSLEHQVALNRQKGEFVAAVSHELRTPLAAMMGSVQTLKRLADRLPVEERDRLFDMGMSQGVRLKCLIEDLLLIAAADHEDIKVDKVPVALASLFESLRDELTPLVGEHLQVVAPGPGTSVLGDEEKLRRILVNLIENARKYAPGGPIELTAQVVGDRTEIAVSDHGPGIRPEDRERVFERFVQLDQSSTRRQGGTGLGLSLCRELAERLDGSLVLEKAASGGARFVLQLPLAAATAQSNGSLKSSLPAGMARSPLRRPTTAPPAVGDDRPMIARSRPAAMARPAATSADGTGTVASVAVAADGDVR